MEQRHFFTEYGEIVYWVHKLSPARKTLVFLPGLTADHRLFDAQAEEFREQYNLLVWDAPGHGASRPFDLQFSLADKARWLHGILEKEVLHKPLLIGQSMGGYVAQAYMELFPGEAGGFVAIDSAPLQKTYVSTPEIWLMRHIEPFYRLYPWKLLVKDGAKGCAATEPGQRLMAQMMQAYENDPAEYCRLAGHGYRMLADAIAADLPYKIDCPAMLLCGDRDRAGSTRAYNKRWAKATGLPLHWIANAGHNSNTDQPEQVNRLIRDFIENKKEAL